MSVVLLTGAAGFIGMSVAEALLRRGDTVIGIDEVNDYYSVSLKEARLARLKAFSNFSFHKINIADREAVFALLPLLADVSYIVQLAGQAGVRYSQENPYAYVESNVLGQVVLLELSRQLPKLKHFVYASSSSVYGGNTKTPFSIEDSVDCPISVYAATKRMDELLAWTYAHTYDLPITGLRFFTVYGPWGRPDMAAYLFAKKILADTPIPIFNHGKMRRDFTYIDDVVQGVLAVIEKPPESFVGQPPVRVYNLGNSRSEDLMDFVFLIEKALGKKAKYDFLPLARGDVQETFADITASTRDFGFLPKTPISEGIPKFIEWFRAYHGVE